MRKIPKFILPGLLVIIIVISGLAIAKHYGFSLETIKFLQDKIHNRGDKVNLKEQLEAELLQKQLNELQDKISRINTNLPDIITTLQLKIISLEQEEQEVLYKDQPFAWTMQNYQIQVPTYDRNPSEIEPVKANLVEQIRKDGGQLLKVKKEETVEKIKEFLYFGYNLDDLEIISHEVILERVKPKAKLALIIDDLGYHWSEFDRMMTIPRPMTFAVIPHLPESVQQAERVLREGYDLILHQPMEPLADLNPGEGAILTRMNQDEIRATLSKNLAALPQGLIGVNNHMGSKATADPIVMSTVLEFFKEQEMFFVDSRTSSQSVVEEVALQLGERYQKNSIFIDNVDQLEDIKTQIRKAAQIALKQGEAVAIGHVKNYTAKAILEMIDDLEQMGVQLIYVKDMIHDRAPINIPN